MAAGHAGGGREIENDFCCYALTSAGIRVACLGGGAFALGDAVALPFEAGSSFISMKSNAPSIRLSEIPSMVTEISRMKILADDRSCRVQKLRKQVPTLIR